MPKVLSTSEMIECLEKLLGVKGALQPEEASFVRNLSDYRRSGTVTRLTDKQVTWLADLHERYCA